SIPRSTSATCSACSLTGRAIATSSLHRATGASPVLASIVLSWNASSATSRSPSLRFPPRCQRPFPPSCTPRRRRGQAITRQSSTGREHRLRFVFDLHEDLRIVRAVEPECPAAHTLILDHEDDVIANLLHVREIEWLIRVTVRGEQARR